MKIQKRVFQLGRIVVLARLDGEQLPRWVRRKGLCTKAMLQFSLTSSKRQSMQQYHMILLYLIIGFVSIVMRLLLSASSVSFSASVVRARPRSY
jgi:hypothetical protein